jgi:putative ABC transport system permease protein
MESTWKKFNPAFPLEYHFLDDAFEKLYLTENRIGKLFNYFAFLAIFISCLGLVGLASFMAEQRTKEIGIRKVLGASVQGISFLLSKEFSKWVLIANIIALPAAYYAVNQWLQNFAYRTSVGVFIYIASALLALIIALLTVSYQSIKAALTNPITALKYE